MYAPELVDLYISAMGYSPAIKNVRVRGWRRDAQFPGFTCVIALSSSGLVGLAYGFLGSPHTWWDHQLRRGLREDHVDSDHARDLTSNYFEVAEIHVDPDQQGQGIGELLLHEVLWNVPAKYALLSTPEVPDENNRAFRLYRRNGFADVLRGFYYFGDERPFAILGARLPLNTGV